MTSKSDGDLWIEAVATYKRKTGRTLKPDSSLLKVQSLDDFGKEVERQTEEFSTFRKDHGKVYAALHKCIKPLECLTDVAQAVISVSPYAPVAIVFGAAKHLLEACDRVSAGYDSVQELFRNIGEVTETYKVIKTGRMDEPLRKKLTDILSFILEIIGTSEKLIEEKRIRRFFRAVLSKEDGIKKSIARLERHIQSELGLVMHLVYGREGEIQDSLTEMKDMIISGHNNVSTSSPLSRVSYVASIGLC